jgi:hypothetical protein
LWLCGCVPVLVHMLVGEGANASLVLVVMVVLGLGTGLGSTRYTHIIVGDVELLGHVGRWVAAGSEP